MCTIYVHCRHIDVFEDSNKHPVKGPVSRPLSNKIQTKYVLNNLTFTWTINSKPQWNRSGSMIMNNISITVDFSWLTMSHRFVSYPRAMFFFEGLKSTIWYNNYLSTLHVRPISYLKNVCNYLNCIKYCAKCKYLFNFIIIIYFFFFAFVMNTRENQFERK